MEKLITILDIDPEAMRNAEAIWSLVEHRAVDVIGDFYASVRKSDVDLVLSDQTIECLTIEQRMHWNSLFKSRFDQKYFNSASLIGIKHREIGLDAKWYIAGYTKIKIDFSQVVLNAPLSLPVKAGFVSTLDKYVALDMALAVSSYTSWLVD